ncbi:Sec-independent protein translocase protein TatB [Candidatus Poriferisodalis sp.]|uniref:Sec-independent protein translocase protein TatB n=1 Tax=Candidatus Poriferisodalis sp. TaxID=3101277 RepID=UPI003B02DAF7
MSLQPAEMLIIVVVALIVLGPTRLPGAIRSVGRAFRQVREFSTTVRQEMDAAISPPAVEPASPPARPAAEPAAGTSEAEHRGGVDELDRDERRDAGDQGDRLDDESATSDGTA